MKFPWFLSMAVGFLSLSQEILWMRYTGFAGRTIPWVFSLVLAIYLLGIARGAMIGKSYCEKTDKLYTVAGKMLLLGGVLDIVGPFIAPLPGMHFFVVVFIYLCALLKGIAFPIAHHLGSSSAAGQVGKSVSRVYFMNIVGSALGPLVTGFWLVDSLGTQETMMLMGVLTCLLGFVCIVRENRGRIAALAGVVAVVASGALVLPSVLLPMMVCTPPDDMQLAHVIETRSGIIHSISAATGGDHTFGGNVYDGRINISPAVNSNGLERLFVLAAAHSAPKKILVVGMSSGAWTRILSGFPGVERIDVVEINPGYLDLIAAYPDVAPVLKDPRVEIHIDDARRWLKRHPDARFDMIVMNASFYWRSYATNLLSQEFLRLVQSHLAPGGILSYNSTNSPDVLKTAESVFPYAFSYMSFVVAADHDFRPQVKRGGARLLRVKLDGRPLLDPSNKGDARFVRETLAEPFLSSTQKIPYLHRAGDIITDWNMITEFRYGHSLSLFCPSVFFHKQK